jgi:hypothetical protein
MPQPLPPPVIPLDPATVATVLTQASTIGGAATRLKTSQKRLRAFCVADDALRPLFYALSDRGSTKRRLGMQRLNFIEVGR